MIKPHLLRTGLVTLVLRLLDLLVGLLLYCFACFLGKKENFFSFFGARGCGILVDVSTRRFDTFPSNFISVCSREAYGCFMKASNPNSFIVLSICGGGGALKFRTAFDIGCLKAISLACK